MGVMDDIYPNELYDATAQMKWGACKALRRGEKEKRGTKKEEEGRRKGGFVR